MFFLLSFYIMIFMINDIFMKWFLIELTTILMISIINMENYNKYLSIIYYCISCTSSIFMILILLIYFNFIVFEIKMFNYLVFISLLLKLGMFPFNLWMISMYDNLEWYQNFLMSSFMKILPSIFMIEMISLNNFILWMLIINVILSSLLTFKFNKLKMIIACSSMNQTSFFIFNLCNNMYNNFYYINYIFEYIKNWKKMDLKNYQMYKMNFLYLMIVFMYCMLPPFFSMIAKLLMLYNIIMLYNYNYIVLFFAMLSSMIMMWNYFNFIDKNISNDFFYKMKIEFNKNKGLMMFVLLIFFINLLLIFF